MTKLFILLFSALTLLAGYYTFNDIGLQDTNFSDSVRSGSGGSGGYRHGK